MTSPPWNARSEGHVAAQMLLLTGIAGLPLLRPAPRASSPLRATGTVLLVAGSVLAGWSALRLGPNLTPLPEPRRDGQLVQTGPYALVRHPVYGGLLLGSAGWALRRGHGGALGLSLLLALLFEHKSRDEEARLMARFPDYPSYRRRVRKFIPWLY